MCFFFFSSRRRHTRLQGDWSSDVCSSDLTKASWWLAVRQGSTAEKIFCITTTVTAHLPTSVKHPASSKPMAPMALACTPPISTTTDGRTFTSPTIPQPVRYTKTRKTGRSLTLHRSEEHTSELQSPCNLVCRLLLEKK